MRRKREISGMDDEVDGIWTANLYKSKQYGIAQPLWAFTANSWFMIYYFTV